MRSKLLFFVLILIISRSFKLSLPRNGCLFALNAVYRRKVRGISNKQEIVSNELIEHPRVRILKSNQEGGDEMLGILPIHEAMHLAEENGSDLVLINDKTDPPICRIIDIDRHKFVLKKRSKELKRKQSQMSVKEVTMSNKIGEGDLDVRIKSVTTFLTDGDKVKSPLLVNRQSCVKG